MNNTVNYNDCRSPVSLLEIYGLCLHSCNIHPIPKIINSHSLAEALITWCYTIVFRVSGSENGRYTARLHRVNYLDNYVQLMKGVIVIMFCMCMIVPCYLSA